MTRRPHVVFILADDMGYGDMGCCNPAVSSTPALDRLAAEGAVFRSMHASSPVCAPARASLMTGRYPQRTGVSDTLDIRGLDRMHENEVTLADYFSNSGYTTALVGKWHLGDGDTCYHPLSRGFDHFCGFCGGWSDYWDYTLEEHGTYQRYENRYITEVFTSKAVEFIEAHHESPFFLHLAYTAPHYPLQAPEELVARYRTASDDTLAVCTLRAMIEVMDRGIGEIIETLEQLGLLDDSLIIFASDNGPDLHGEGEMNLERYNCDLRGEKTLVYEGGIAVPWIMRLPGRIEGGSSFSQPLCGIDLLPSLMSLCDLSPIPDAPEIDGVDFSPLFFHGSLAARDLFWHWNRYAPQIKVNAAVTDGRYKLLHAPVAEYLCVPEEELALDHYKAYHREEPAVLLDTPFPERASVAEAVIELFDLQVDPWESSDIASVHPEVTSNLEDRLNRWYTIVRSLQ